MFSTDKSDFKEEIETFLARGGKVQELPPQENPVRISAQTRILDDEEDDETFVYSRSLVGDSNPFSNR